MTPISAITTTTPGSPTEKALMHLGFIFAMAFQPFLYLIPAISASVPSGNNAFRQIPSYGDRMFIEDDTIWEMFPDNSAAKTFAANATSEIGSYAQKKYAGVKNTNFKDADLEEVEAYSSPTFMNDETKDQMQLQSCGKEAYER
jgi:hypothetical protein